MKGLLIPIVFLLFLSVPVSATGYHWCYQEFANESSACGAVGTGYYDEYPAQPYLDPANWHDGDWDTKSTPPWNTNGNGIINYTIPFGTDLANSILQYKGGGGEGRMNFTIGLDKYRGEDGVGEWFKVQLGGHEGVAINQLIIGYGAGQDRIFYSYGEGGAAYEEGMFWKIADEEPFIRYSDIEGVPPIGTYFGGHVGDACMFNMTWTTNSAVDNAWIWHDMGDYYIENNYTMSSLGDGKYSYPFTCPIGQLVNRNNVRFCANDTFGNQNCTENMVFTFYASNMTFSDINASLSFDSSEFSVSAIDIVYDRWYPPYFIETPIERVLFESDWSGISANYSMTQDGNTFSYQAGIPSGTTFHARICADNTWTCSSVWLAPPCHTWTCTDEQEWTVPTAPDQTLLMFQPIILLLIGVGLFLFMFRQFREGELSMNKLIGIILTIVVAMGFIAVISGIA